MKGGQGAGHTEPCSRCGNYVCSCTSGPSFWRQLRDLFTTDPMVPKGYIEVRDSGGKLLSRHRIEGGNQ